jgi:UDP-N-acetylglucosamine--N-acetylmuramyl-(pentapeptide) pyrophosphoryl-undecaprenol N-acetylglucosamine transferase
MSAGPVMIMAGGTGGHVFPGLAVAEELAERDWPVVWLGTDAGLEARVVPSRGIEMQRISVTGIRGRGLLAWLAAPFRIVIAVAQARRVLKRCRPAVVLGMGGFVSGPGGLAAWLARIPLLIHEQNAIAGTTNRILARFARRVYEAFPGSFATRIHAETIGNPVRRTIARLVPPERPREPRPRLLVLGGSQGALALNRMVPEALAMLGDYRLDVRHQAGRTFDTAREAYAAAGVEVDLVEFIDDMAQAYAWADIVIARAGALTLAELAAAGLGAILVPYPYAIDDHQQRNAEHFATGGAAVVLKESELTATRLAQALEQCLSQPGQIRKMADAAHSKATPDAAGVLASACLDLAEAA